MMIVSPLAIRPERTSEAEALRSVAITWAPERGALPLDRGLVSLNLDVGTESQQFVDVGEPPVEDGLGDDGCPQGLGHQDHELGLHVRWEAGIRGGDDILGA